MVEDILHSVDIKKKLGLYITHRPNHHTYKKYNGSKIQINSI